jgi:hypothetical protein
VPKNFAKPALVEVHDPATTCSKFMDLREQEAAAEAGIKILKPIIAKLVGRGKKKTDLEGFRDGKKGKFIVTIVPRDLRKPAQGPTVEWLKANDHWNAIKTVEMYDEEKLAKLIEDGDLDKDTLRTLLVGTASSYPTVVFKPGQ